MGNNLNCGYTRSWAPTSYAITVNRIKHFHKAWGKITEKVILILPEWMPKKGGRKAGICLEGQNFWEFWGVSIIYYPVTCTIPTCHTYIDLKSESTQGNRSPSTFDFCSLSKCTVLPNSSLQRTCTLNYFSFYWRVKQYDCIPPQTLFFYRVFLNWISCCFESRGYKQRIIQF